MNVMEIMVPEGPMAFMNLVHLAFLLAEQDHLVEVASDAEEIIEDVTLSPPAEMENIPMKKAEKNSEDIVITVKANITVEAEKNLERKHLLPMQRLERVLPDHNVALEISRARKEIVAERVSISMKNHRMLKQEKGHKARSHGEDPNTTDAMDQVAEEDGAFEVEADVDHMVDIKVGEDPTAIMEDAAHLHSPAQVAHSTLVQ